MSNRIPFKLLIVANKQEATEMKKLVKELADFYNPVVDIETTIVQSNYPDVPFETYRWIEGKEYRGVAKWWYDQNISIRSVSHDAVAFSLNRAEWDGAGAGGWRTDNDYGAVEVQIGTDLNRYFKNDKHGRTGNIWLSHMKHELSHTFCYLLGIPDRTHELFYTESDGDIIGYIDAHKHLWDPKKTAPKAEAIRGSFTKVMSPNHWKEGIGLEKDVVVLHATTSRFESAVAWLADRTSEVSAHFLVDHTRAVLMVNPESDAWHTGVTGKATPLGQKQLNAHLPQKNPNRFTYGIEQCLYYDADGNGVITEEEKQAYGKMLDNTVRAIRALQTLRGKAFTAEQIVTHRDFYSVKPQLDITRSRVLELLGLKEATEPIDNGQDLENTLEKLNAKKTSLMLLFIQLLEQKVRELKAELNNTTWK